MCVCVYELCALCIRHNTLRPIFTWFTSDSKIHFHKYLRGIFRAWYATNITIFSIFELQKENRNLCTTFRIGGWSTFSRFQSLVHYTWFLRSILLISALFEISFDLSSGCFSIHPTTNLPIFPCYTLHAFPIFYDWYPNCRYTMYFVTYIRSYSSFFSFSFHNHQKTVPTSKCRRAMITKKKRWLSFKQTHSSCFSFFITSARPKRWENENLWRVKQNRARFHFKYF